MLVIHISTECYPAVKTGGLADVIGALPKYLKNNNTDSRVIIPYIKNTFTHSEELIKIYEGVVVLGEENTTYTIFENNSLDFKLYFVYIPELLDKTNTYGYENDNLRFLAFQVATLEWLNNWNQKIDVLHCHDHNVALIPFFIKYSDQYESLKDVSSIFTIHSTKFQGVMPLSMMKLFPNFNPIYTKHLIWRDSINSMACGIKCADTVTTVSPHYMKQLCFESHGLEYVFQINRYKCTGILNGIDDFVWNPETDPMIPANYNIQKVEKGKALNKKQLCSILNFEEKKPIIAFIGRLDFDKGGDILEKLIRKNIESDLPFNFVNMGEGEQGIIEELQELEKSYQDKIKIFTKIDEDIVHCLLAGADFYLKPSREEPCGLRQMYALKYGTVPIVSNVGGLEDTVKSFEEGDGYGIKFSYYSVEDILFSMIKAEKIYQDKGLLHILRKRMMKLDFSWTNQAKQYIELYKKLTLNKEMSWKLI